MEVNSVSEKPKIWGNTLKHYIIGESGLTSLPRVSKEWIPRSSLCLDLNMTWEWWEYEMVQESGDFTSFWGISRRLGGPKGVQIQKRARGGSSVFLFWPCNVLILPRMSRRCKCKICICLFATNVLSYQKPWCVVEKAPKSDGKGSF